MAPILLHSNKDPLNVTHLHMDSLSLAHVHLNESVEMSRLNATNSFLQRPQYLAEFNENLFEKLWSAA